MPNDQADDVIEARRAQVRRVATMRKEERKAKARERMLSREAQKRVGAQIVIQTSADVQERAQRACLKTEGADLVSHLRDLVYGFADLPEGQLTASEKQARRGFSFSGPYQQEMLENLRLSLEEIQSEYPNGYTMDEIIADVCMLPPEGDSRSARTMYGRMMVALGWKKCATYDAGTRKAGWIYRKPDWIDPRLPSRKVAT